MSIQGMTITMQVICVYIHLVSLYYRRRFSHCMWTLNCSNPLCWPTSDILMKKQVRFQWPMLWENKVAGFPIHKSWISSHNRHVLHPYMIINRKNKNMLIVLLQLVVLHDISSLFSSLISLFFNNFYECIYLYQWMI